jgi:CheY-like chemotaxis protein
VTPVAAVADGMKAWEVMRGRAYAFDLVLTEVNMPTLSGIDLLSRIVAADECRNIPVISKQPPFLSFHRHALLLLLPLLLCVIA